MGCCVWRYGVVQPSLALTEATRVALRALPYEASPGCSNAIGLVEDTRSRRESQSDLEVSNVAKSDLKATLDVGPREDTLQPAVR